MWRIKYSFTILFALSLIFVSTGFISAQREAFPAIAELCGAGAEIAERQAEINQWAALFRRSRKTDETALAAAPATRISKDIFLMRADQETAPFDDPVDFENAAFRFTRLDAKTFEVKRGDLVYDQEIGTLFSSFGRNETVKAYQLPFNFPFGEQSYQQIFLSVARGIHFAQPDGYPQKQFGALEYLVSRSPLVSPLYDFSGSPSGPPDLYLKQTAGAVTLTWRSKNQGDLAFDIQAVLYGNGDLLFSYRAIKKLAWGGVIVTTGSDDWLNQRELLFTANDPVGDVNTEVNPQISGMLDIIAVEGYRIAGSDLIELRLKIKDKIDRATLPGGSSYLFYVGDSINRLLVSVFPDRHGYEIPILGDLGDSSAARINESEIVFYITQDLLPLPSSKIKLWAYTATSSQNGDQFAADINWENVSQRAETDFSALTEIETGAPLIEAFHLPSVNLFAVWDRLKREYGYRDDEIDAVAVYQNFFTDRLVAGHFAYATGGNNGADGVSSGSGTRFPKSPTLLMMNTLGYFVNSTPVSRSNLLAHEFGHRWLYFFRIKEGVRDTLSLNPLGVHPAQFVHTPAAFPVLEANDSSVMGGAMFTDLGNGSFKTPAQVGPNGYSWHELYLMGLADPSEVAPWFYIRNSNPPLGDEYHPQGNLTVTGERVNVGLQQIIDAMGPRVPGFAESQKKFRVLFVFLERPGAPMKDEEIDESYRTHFEEYFAKATGGRGQLLTEVSLAPPRAAFAVASGPGRGSTASAEVPTQHVSFIDQSHDNPTSWLWDFGDGASSTLRNPTHLYAQGGTYTVTLTVTNAKGGDATSQTIRVRSKINRPGGRLISSP